MAEQATGAVAGSTGGAAGTLAHGTAHAEHNPGRPMSWAGVTVVVIGFIVGAVSFVPHMTWWAFWAGTGIVVLGCLMLAFTKTFNEDWY